MTDTAEADLAEIWAYIAADSESAATRLLDKVEATCARLLDFPSSGLRAIDWRAAFALCFKAITPSITQSPKPRLLSSASCTAPATPP